LTSLPVPTSSDVLWTRRFWQFLAAVFIFRALFILFFTASADLLGDEAYYWDWGRRLDWGYFSKPPMIGWLMGLVGWLTNNAEWGVRGAALVLGTGTLACVFLLGRRLYDARTAFLASVLILLTPGNAGLNLFFTIDAPLLLTWTLALLLFWFAAEKPECWTRWLTLALVIGLGTLSKQMMLVIPVFMILFAATSPPDRALLKNPRLWVTIIIGFLFLTPVILWNQSHHWITLEHTKHHFDAKSLDFAGKLVRTLQFPGVQALVYTPVIFAALITVMWLTARHWSRLQRADRFLLLFSAPALVGFVLLSLRQNINPNWPAVFYVPAFILTAAWWHGCLPFAASPKWRHWSVKTAIGCTVTVHLLIIGIIGPRPEFWEKTIDFTQTHVSDKLAARIKKSVAKLGNVKGWHEVGLQAGAFLDKIPQPNKTFVLAIGYRYDAAQLAFNMPQHPRVYRWEPSGQIMSQYEVWPGPEERLGDDALIFVPGKETPRVLPNIIAKHFESVDTLGQVIVPLGKERRIFDVYLGHKLLTWQAAGSEVISSAAGTPAAP
jgi:hypothetical protein